MTNTQENKALYRNTIESLQNQAQVLTAQTESAQAGFVKGLIAQGWKEFQFSSFYFGNHEELGEGDQEATFLFHPEVDLSCWHGVSFSHGHSAQGENNIKFDEWLSQISDDLYVEL